MANEGNLKLCETLFPGGVDTVSVSESRVFIGTWSQMAETRREAQARRLVESKKEVRGQRAARFRCPTKLLARQLPSARTIVWAAWYSGSTSGLARTEEGVPCCQAVPDLAVSILPSEGGRCCSGRRSEAIGSGCGTAARELRGQPIVSN